MLRAVLAELEQKTEPENTQMVELINVLRAITLAIANPGYVDKTANQMRAQVSGSLTTVATVTGLTNIDSYQGRLLMVGQNISAWANVVRSRIS